MLPCARSCFSYPSRGLGFLEAPAPTVIYSLTPSFSTGGKTFRICGGLLSLELLTQSLVFGLFSGKLFLVPPFFVGPALLPVLIDLGFQGFDLLI